MNAEKLLKAFPDKLPSKYTCRKQTPCSYYSTVQCARLYKIFKYNNPKRWRMPHTGYAANCKIRHQMCQDAAKGQLAIMLF